MPPIDQQPIDIINQNIEMKPAIEMVKNHLVLVSDELKELNQDLEQLFNQIKFNIIFLDKNLMIRRITPKNFSPFNISSQDLGKNIEEFIHGIKFKKILESLKQVLETGITVEHEFNDNYGRNYFLQIFPYHVNESINGLILITIEHKKLSRITTNLQRRDEFLAILSHELRNPLAAIINATNTLRSLSKYYPTVVNTWSDIIDRQSKQMVKVLDDLLDISRITQNKLILNQKIFDISILIPDAIQIFEDAINKRKINITFDLGKEPMLVNGDPIKLAQVLNHLLNNAIKYSNIHGQIFVALESNQNQIIIKVRDNGMGIAKESLEAIFELFTQSEQIFDYRERGIGVGLTLARAIVQLHGGSISAHSKGLGYGSEFIVILPKAKI